MHIYTFTSIQRNVYLFIYYNNFICNNNQYKKAAIREELNPHVVKVFVHVSNVNSHYQCNLYLYMAIVLLVCVFIKV